MFEMAVFKQGNLEDVEMTYPLHRISVRTNINLKLFIIMRLI